MWIQILKQWFLYFYCFNETPLNAAVKKGNFEIVKLLLNCKDIDVNSKTVLNEYLYRFNRLFHKVFKYNFKKFLLIYFNSI